MIRLTLMRGKREIEDDSPDTAGRICGFEFLRYFQIDQILQIFIASKYTQFLIHFLHEFFYSLLDHHFVWDEISFINIHTILYKIQ